MRYLGRDSMINSPLNYTGNKFKLLNQIIPFLNNQSNKLVDVFAGSGLVGLNANADIVILNDNDKITIELLNYFKNNDSKKIIKDMDTIIQKYKFTDSHRNGLHFYKEEKHEGLSKYNKVPFGELKDDYNKNPTVDKLFALIIFGFNHYIRFNNSGLYNVPVGKVDYSTSLRDKTEEYTKIFKEKKVKITNYDFRNKKLYKDETALYYFDPPYLITQAPYNISWSEDDEKDLLKLLDSLNEKGIKFALSNVIESNGKTNYLLKEWSKKYNIHFLNRKYLNANYRKKNITIAQEVLITNFKEVSMKKKETTIDNNQENSYGVAGNRKGNKLYSFNTSIRIPDKNIEFLKIFKKYSGKLFTEKTKIQVYKDAIQYGAFTPVRLDETSKQKIEQGETLTDDELFQIMKKNKPSNGFTGRVGDYVMALENQALIQRLGTNRKYRIRITELGDQLLKDSSYEQDIYKKAMIGLEYRSPVRETASNKSNPFLNTIFIINELNEYYKDDKKYKGITLYEFGVFILTMKNCNYTKIVNKIIDYRKTHGTKEDDKFAKKYLKDNNIESYNKDTLYGSASYADEVLRKFKKTGLIVEKAGFRTRYIDFNRHELTKVQLILDKYHNYKWKKFRDSDQYFEYIENIVLPWEESNSSYFKVIESKAKEIGYDVNQETLTPKKYQEINQLYYQYVFENNNYDEFPYENIKMELGLINRTVDGKTSLSDIEEYVRFEFFTALLLASKFGKEQVKGNLILDENGLPLSQAPGGNADVEFFNDRFHYNIEVTTIRNRNQQLNAETTTVARHLASSLKEKVVNKALLIAPFIHEDTIRYYRFEALDQDVTMVPMTIDMLIKIVDKAKNLKEFDTLIEKIAKKLKKESVEDYKKFISEYE